MSGENFFDVCGSTSTVTPKDNNAEVAPKGLKAMSLDLGVCQHSALVPALATRAQS